MNRSTKESAGALGGRERFADPHAPHTLPERVDADRVPIAEEVTRRGVVGEGVHDRLGRPVCGGVLGGVEVEDPPARVGEDDQDEEHAQARGGEAEEIEGDQVLDAVGEERAPGLGRRGMPHARAGISRGPETALSGGDGARQGQRVRTTIRRGQARYGLKNLRAWSQT